jgi:hypothetical protein
MFGSCNVLITVRKKFFLKYAVILVLLQVVSYSCNSEVSTEKVQVKEETLLYLNHSDSTKYVGMNTCKPCHQSIYNTFIETGMGKSFDGASREKSSGDFTKASIYDKISNLHYQAYWSDDSLFIKEFRLDKKDTIHQRTEQVNYIIGSGQHTNSHMQTVNGYINQMPMTYYTQKKHWDLPPGFENGVNTRFSRKIGLECMTCHNAYPEFVMGSENKFKRVANGIDCERCHGPGSIHVEQRSTGTKIDTSKYIDYSIVNPAKLSIDAQFDICQRCHLQGNAVLKDNKSFYDFKPGQKLSDFISVFLPRYENADDEFIMASHADRLKQSACFIKSYEKVKDNHSLKPYKDALTCITCHNPHVSVKQTNKNVFNDACTNCHNQAEKLKSSHVQLQKGNWSNCVSCHMPASGSTDIPHVSVHDHFIRKPITKNEKNKIKTFLGLYAINEKNPDDLTRAKAYIDQYSKFDQNVSYLDTALNILNKENDLKKKIHSLIQIYFIQQKFSQVISLTNSLGEKTCDSLFSKQSYDNKDAWASYRIAEAYSNTSKNDLALKWFQKAVKLAPYNLDYRNKLGSTLVASNQVNSAIEQFEFILKENPNFVSAYSNLGYIKLMQGFPAEAIRLYLIGQKLDPDNEALLLNLAGYYAFMKDLSSAKKYVERVIKLNPNNTKAQMILTQLSSL